jgi:hypothetical protein
MNPRCRRFMHRVEPAWKPGNPKIYRTTAR